MQVEIPPDADADEAAAIVAAVRSHVAALEAAAADDGDADDDWHGDRWRFTGRLNSLQNRRSRVPTDAPRNEWAAAGRTDRY